MCQGMQSTLLLLSPIGSLTAISYLATHAQWYSWPEVASHPDPADMRLTPEDVARKNTPLLLYTASITYLVPCCQRFQCTSHV